MKRYFLTVPQQVLHVHDLVRVTADYIQLNCTSEHAKVEGVDPTPKPL